MRCWTFKFAAAALLLMVSSLVGLTQDTRSEEDYPAWDTDARLGKPFFVLKTYQRLGGHDGKIRVDAAVEVIHDVLQFARQDSHYVAEVELNISLARKIKKKKTELVSREIRYLKKRVRNYEATNSRKERLTGIFPLYADPGDYKLTVVLTDKESNRRTSLERDINFRQFDRNSLLLSDIISSSSAGVDRNTGLPELPTASGEAVDSTLPVVTVFDLWRPDPMAVAMVRMEVRSWKGVVVRSDSLSVFGGDRLGTYWFEVDPTGLSFGKYDIVLTAQSDSMRIEKKSEFGLNFFGLPQSIQDVEQAIDQLAIIADKADIARLRALPQSQKEEALTEFWDRNFPSPNEETNGKMIEFYDRVNYANAEFSDGGVGWQTDRGRVYIIYGRPSEVERQIQPEQDAPYEIWYYHHLGRRFVFRDEHGFGDYRLVTPLW